ncbi:hypothetical protein BGZ54_010057 [Gamsiella multidivaricata]|nr:hypothetical protein BGZ54_010057 [Gamsiella multidivaricata]
MRPTGISTPITKSTHSGGEKPSSGPKTLSRPSSSSSSSSSSLTGVATPGEIARTADEYFQQAGPPQGYKSTFLASDEARHILDLPSLLGKDPNMIPAVLAVPIPLQPTRPSKGRSSSVPSSTAAGSTAGPSSDQEADTQASKAVSDLDAKARSTAKAMTKRYAAKNLNMTETEAHRMVQLMAAEIVALHEERQAMVRKMEQAKQEMLEAARLLRMKAAGGPQTGTMGEKPQDMSDEEEGRQGLDAGLYDKDEWRR